MIQEASPDAGTTVLTRDARGLVTQETDGRGVVTNRTYDNAGRLLTESYPAATAENVTYTYDNVTTPATNKGKGRLTGITDQSGQHGSVRNLVHGAGFILGLEPVSKDDSELSPRFEPFSRRRFPSVVCVVQNQVQQF